MFQTVAGFLDVWLEESDGTLKVLRALTEASLTQAVRPGGRTLGRLAWHITMSLREMLDESQLPIAGPRGDDPQPPLDEIVRLYEAGSKAVAAAVGERWTDTQLGEEVDMYGEQWTRGKVLWVLIAHEIHHRAQMTVLMRQAGLKVPGLYGPAYEEWAAYNAPPQP